MHPFLKAFKFLHINKHIKKFIYFKHSTTIKDGWLYHNITILTFLDPKGSIPLESFYFGLINPQGIDNQLCSPRTHICHTLPFHIGTLRSNMATNVAHVTNGTKVRECTSLICCGLLGGLLDLVLPWGQLWKRSLEDF